MVLRRLSGGTWQDGRMSNRRCPSDQSTQNSLTIRKPLPPSRVRTLQRFDPLSGCSVVTQVGREKAPGSHPPARIAAAAAAASGTDCQKTCTRCVVGSVSRATRPERAPRAPPFVHRSAAFGNGSVRRCNDRVGLSRLVGRAAAASTHSQSHYAAATVERAAFQSAVITTNAGWSHRGRS
jgi:hypothetical protein